MYRWPRMREHGLRLVVLTTAIAFVRAASTAAQASATAFVRVAVVPMDRERVLTDQTVVVQGDRITALGPASKVTVPTGATRIDGRGTFLVPGLADMHVHLEHGSAETWRKVLWLYLANGITTVRDMHSTRTGGAQSVPLVLRRQVAAGELLGPRIYTAGDPDVSSPEAAAQSVEALRALDPDFVKIGSEETPGPVYDSIFAAADRTVARLVGHVPGDRGLDRVFQDHWASIEHLTGYHDYLLGTKNLESGFPFQPDAERWVDTASWMRPGYRLDAARLRQVAMATRRAGVWNCPTLALWLQMTTVIERIARADTARTTALMHTAIPLTHRAAEFSMQITKALQDAGAGLLLGTDLPGVFTGTPNGFTIHDELAALVRAGLTPYQALATGTRNVAQFLGTLDSTGTIAPGKRADLVLVSGNPLKDIGYMAGPAGVMVGGRWLPRAELNAILDTLPLEPTVAAEVKQARQRIWQH